MRSPLCGRNEREGAGKGYDDVVGACANYNRDSCTNLERYGNGPKTMSDDAVIKMSWRKNKYIEVDKTSNNITL